MSGAMSGAYVTTFHVGGIDDKVDVLFYRRATIDDVIATLKDAVACAEAEKSQQVTAAAALWPYFAEPDPCV